MPDPGFVLRLTAHNLCVRRGDRLVLDGLSFATGAGQALLLTGPNGAGKTTLLRTIAGFLPPEAGEIALTGGDDSDAEVGERAHYVGHANGIKASLTAFENLDFWCAYLGGATTPSARQDRIHDALERLRLASLADIPAAYLSAGQKRRLGLGRLLVADRPLWLLDEPTVSLDTASVTLLAGIVTQHLTAGGLVLAATHIPLGLQSARELRLAGVAASRLVSVDGGRGPPLNTGLPSVEDQGDTGLPSVEKPQQGPKE